MNQRLSHRSVTQRVIEQIREAILQGELKPGDRLPTESELCQIWDVSRTPIREAVKVLEFMGILEIQRSKGTFVCSEIKPAALNPLLFRLFFMTESVDQLIEFRQAVDSMVLNLAIAKATESDIAALEADVAAIEQAIETKAPPEEITVLDIDFHNKVAAATGNGLIQELARELHTIFEPSIRQSHREIGSKGAYEHHRKILEAIKQRSTALGETALAESMNAWRAYVRYLPKGVHP